MRLFQYWDTGSPPDDVAGWIESFRAMNPGLKHRLYDRDAASWFIGKHLGERQRRAFEACAVPAMQADYFRLCALIAKGGIWADVDLVCAKPLRPLLAEAPTGLIPMMWNQLVNGFLFVPGPGDTFVAACLELATRNIETRREIGVHDATGSPVLNAIWAAIEPVSEHSDPHLVRLQDPQNLMAEAQRVFALYPGADRAFRRFSRRHVLWLHQCLADGQAAYKAGDRHWLNWRGTIYRETVPAQQG